MKHSHFLVPLMVAGLIIITDTAAAQTMMRRDRDLNFGLFGVNSNNAQHRLSVDINGNITMDAPFTLSNPGPQAAEIHLSGLTPDVPLHITFTDGTMTLNGGGGLPALHIVDFTANGPPFTSTAAGTLDLTIGATLRTSGSGTPYPSGMYNGSFTITIDY